MAAPCGLFSSCSDSFHPDEFIKCTVILCTNDLSSAKYVTESIKSYNWHIDTKYYTADVNLCTSSSRTIGNQDFADTVQAFIVYFDPKQAATFDLAKAWMPYLEQIEPEILILACDNCSQEDAVSRICAQQWCIDNGFELVELNPIQDDDNDEVEDDFVETTGIKRIIQALHAHTWPNLHMKENPVVGSPYYRQLLKEETELKAKEIQSQEKSVDIQLSTVEPPHVSQAVSASQSDEKLKSASDSQSDEKLKSASDSQSDEKLKSASDSQSDEKLKSATDSQSDEKLKSATDSQSDEKLESASGVSGSEKSDPERKKKAKGPKKKKQSKVEMIDNLLPEGQMTVIAALGDDDPGEESFQQMFEKLKVMKERAETLPPEQRKDYAEQIAVSFWNAIGGDAAEIDGLDDGDTGLDPS